MKRGILGLWVSLAPLAVMGQESKPLNTAEKNQYWLFKPTPRSLMREMSTDRPDQTESAYTVDAGHFQVESDLFSYTFDKSGEQRFDGFSPSTLNLKIGVLNNVDLQVGLSPHIYERTSDLATKDKVHSRGFGDVVTSTLTNKYRYII